MQKLQGHCWILLKKISLEYLIGSEIKKERNGNEMAMNVVLVENQLVTVCAKTCLWKFVLYCSNVNHFEQ